MKSSELIHIIQENPDLEVMVLSKGVCDEYNNIGTITKVEVGEYIICRDYTTLVKGRDSDYVCVTENFCVDPYIYYDMPEEQLKQEYDLLPWKKAILVYVEVARS